MNGGRLWSRTFTALVAANFFTGLVFYLLATTVAAYAMDRFQVTPGAAGVAVGAYAIGTVLLRVFMGRYMETLGVRRLVWLGTAAYAVLSLAYLAAECFWPPPSALRRDTERFTPAAMPWP